MYNHFSNAHHVIVDISLKTPQEITIDSLKFAHSIEKPFLKINSWPHSKIKFSLKIQDLIINLSSKIAFFISTFQISSQSITTSLKT